MKIFAVLQRRRFCISIKSTQGVTRPMWIPIYITISLVPLIHAESYLRNFCMTPMRLKGICVDVKYCHRIFLEQKRFSIVTAKLFFRASICGFENNATKVCCPHIWLNPINAIPLRTPERITTRRYGPIYSPDCGTARAESMRIVGGRNSPLGAWPWMVALGYHLEGNFKYLKWGCAGSLISTRHVLSAAHCMYIDSVGLYAARVGDLNLDDRVQDGATPMDIKIDVIHVHPGYSLSNNSNDIAVLRLERDIIFTSLIKPICLPLLREISQADYTQTMAWVAGWGDIEYAGPSSSQLQDTQILVVNTSLCERRYSTHKHPVVKNEVICAGYLPGGRDTCQGDSGGPLMTFRGGTFYIIGIVSYGYKCALQGVPGVYTRVSSFLKWIISKLY